MLHLGLALADAGERVALVDADLRAGSLSRRLGRTGEPGLAEVLSGETDVAGRIARPPDPCLSPIRRAALSIRVSPSPARYVPTLRRSGVPP